MKRIDMAPGMEVMVNLTGSLYNPAYIVSTEGAWGSSIGGEPMEYELPNGQVASGKVYCHAGRTGGKVLVAMKQRGWDREVQWALTSVYPRNIRSMEQHRQAEDRAEWERERRERERQQRERERQHLLSRSRRAVGALTDCARLLDDRSAVIDDRNGRITLSLEYAEALAQALAERGVVDA